MNVHDQCYLVLPYAELVKYASGDDESECANAH
jgi:hypothetical protein